MLRYDTGELLWSYLVGSSITAAVAVVDGWIVVGAADGVLYAFGDGK
jgi:outer membrane protein assembly factor BamB